MKLSRTAAGLRSHTNSAPAKPRLRTAPAVKNRPLGSLSFLGFAVISFGGPLALAGLIAPATIAGAGSRAGGSSGLEILIATAAFAAPLVIWLRYSKHVHGSGGLYDFVKAAAGPRVALAAAAIWTVSYPIEGNARHRC